MAHGKKVGTFTSPHMISIHDRFVLGISRFQMKILLGLVQEVQQMEQTLLQTEDQLSYFEIICLMALLYFKEQAVDVVLLEVGIGGLLGHDQCSDGRDRSDHFGWPGSPGNTGRDDCGNRLAKAGIFKKGKKLWWVPYRMML